MSCHDIGHAVDFIISKVLEMYDEGKISKEATQEMLGEFPSAVNYCDGNDYEALETLTETHCERCLKRYENDTQRITVEKAYNEVKQDDFVKQDKYKYDWWFQSTRDIGSVGRSFCPDCFRNVFKNKLKKTAIERIIKKATEKEAE